MPKKNSPLGIAVLMGSAIIWGFAFVFQVKSDLGSFWFNGIRFTIGCLTLLPFILLIERRAVFNKETIKKLLLWGGLTGVALFFASSTQMAGILMSRNSAKAGFLTGIYMILVPFLCAVFFRDKIRAHSIVAALAGAGGLLLICLSNKADFSFEWGDVLIIISALGFALQIICIDKKASDLPPLAFSFVQFLAVAVLSLPCALLFERHIEINMQTIGDNLVGILYCGIMSSGMGYTGQVIGQRLVQPDLASIIMCTESVWATIGGWLLLHENLGWKGYLGCAMVLSGILLSKFGDRILNSLRSVRKKNKEETGD